MKLKYLIFSVAIGLLAFSSCNKDPIADDVYKMKKLPQENLDYRLSVSVKGLEADKEYFLVGQTHTQFNERGEGSVKNLQDYLIVEKVLPNGNVSLSDLKPYYKQTLYFNVLEKDNDSYTLLTNTGNELSYTVVFGDNNASIDLSAKAEVRVKQTKLTFSLPSEYVGKELFLIPKEQKANFEDKLKSGSSIDEDIILYHIDNASETVSIYMNTPKKVEECILYVVKPTEELPFVYKDFSLSTDSNPISVDIQKEEKKVINISITRGEDRFDKAEVYLVDADKWNDVQNQMSKNHGSPEIGSYIMKTISNNGDATFELYQIEGERDLVVVVPKWNSSYYDSFEMRRFSINAKTNTYNVDVTADFNPITTGGGVEVKKTVTFNVSTDLPSGYLINPYVSYVYILKDASMFADAWTAIKESRSFEGLYKSNEAVDKDYDNGGYIKVSVADCEIDTSKEVLVIVTVLKIGPYSMFPLVKRINGSSIKSDTIDVTVDAVENP